MDRFAVFFCKKLRLNLDADCHFEVLSPPLVSTVSICTNSTSTNFSAIGIKLVLVELLCSKIRTSGNWLYSTH